MMAGNAIAKRPEVTPPRVTLARTNGAYRGRVSDVKPPIDGMTPRLAATSTASLTRRRTRLVAFRGGAAAMELRVMAVQVPVAHRCLDLIGREMPEHLFRRHVVVQR